jgi:ketosteroid isomerase-like protein
MTDVEDVERAALSRLVETFMSLFSQQRWDEWIELWADDAVLEFPFAPAGRRSRYAGKLAILAYMKPLAGRMKLDQMEYLDIHPMRDPTMACMELGIRGHIVATGASFRQKYISIIETRQGRLLRYREYWNPLIAMDANGGREAWIAAFGSPEAEAAP